MLRPESITHARASAIEPISFGAGRWLCSLGRAGGKISLVCGLSVGCAHFADSPQETAAQSQRVIKRALAAEDRGDMRAAESILAQALAKNPHDEETRWELVKLLLERGSTDAAITHMQYLVDQQPDDERSYVQLARTLYQQKRYSDASPLVKLALSLNPNSAEALVLKGMLDERDLNDDSALEAYYRVLLNEPESVEALARIAAIHVRHGKPEEAAPLLRFAQESCPVSSSQSREIQWLLGVAYAQNERWTEAAAALYAGLPIDHPTADAYYRLAYARYRAGDTEGALQDAARALAIQPQHPSAASLCAQLNPAQTLPGDAGSRRLIPVQYLRPQR